MSDSSEENSSKGDVSFEDLCEELEDLTMDQNGNKEDKKGEKEKPKQEKKKEDSKKPEEAEKPKKTLKLSMSKRKAASREQDQAQNSGNPAINSGQISQNSGQISNRSLVLPQDEAQKKNKPTGKGGRIPAEKNKFGTNPNYQPTTSSKPTTPSTLPPSIPPSASASFVLPNGPGTVTRVTVALPPAQSTGVPAPSGETVAPSNKKKSPVVQPNNNNASPQQKPLGTVHPQPQSSQQNPTPTPVQQGAFSGQQYNQGTGSGYNPNGYQPQGYYQPPQPYYQTPHYQGYVNHGSQYPVFNQIETNQSFFPPYGGHNPPNNTAHDGTPPAQNTSQTATAPSGQGPSSSAASQPGGGSPLSNYISSEIASYDWSDVKPEEGFNNPSEPMNDEDIQIINEVIVDEYVRGARGPERGTGGRPRLEHNKHKNSRSTPYSRPAASSESPSIMDVLQNLQLKIGQLEESVKKSNNPTNSLKTTSKRGGKAKNKSGRQESCQQGGPGGPAGRVSLPFVNPGPRQVAVLVTCDEFKEIYRDDMEYDFGYREGIDTIARSAIRDEIFLVKKVIEDNLEESLDRLGMMWFKGARVEATPFKNEYPYKLPRTTLFTDKKRL